MKYELYSGDKCLAAYDNPEDAPVMFYPPWLWRYGAIIVDGQLYLVDDDLEMMVDGRRAWRQKLPEGAIERRELPLQGCCRA